MRMLRSFLLRLGLILSITAVICLVLMVATLAIQNQIEAAKFCGLLGFLLLVWLLFNWYIVRKIDPELSLEVARIVFPAGMVFSLLLSSTLALYLSDMIPGDEGKQHMILPFVGVGVTFFLVVRCFDLKWLRPEEEIAKVDRAARS